MTDTDKLAQVLAEHADWRFHSNLAWSCQCGEPLIVPEGLVRPVYERHLAAVVLAHLTAEGWAQGREEWGVVVHEPKFVDHGRLITNYRADREAAEKFAAPRRFYSLARRYVTDWEPVETGDQE